MKTWKPHPRQEEALLVAPNQAFEILFGGARGGGKEISVTTKVFTDSGWKNAGEITYVDKLLAPDGTYTNILGIYPQGIKPLYRVTFEDGAYVDAGLEHQWLVHSGSHGKRDGWVVRNTEFLLKTKDRYAIPLIEKPAPGTYIPGYDPYILGYIIGNGTTTGYAPIIYTSDIEVVDYLRVNKWTVHQYKKSVYQCHLSIISEKNKVYKEIGKYSGQQKHIPENLLHAVPEARIALLQGLMDSDGTVDKNSGACSYSTSVHKLAEDVVYLVRSLGGKASIETKKRVGGGVLQGKYKGNYNEKDVRVSHCNRFMPFRLSRKKTRCRTAIYDKRYITKIEYQKEEEAVCFFVNHCSHLFVVQDFVVTHNTDTGQAWLLYDSENPQMRGLVIRRNADDLRDWIDRARVFYTGRAELVGNPPEVRFKEGAIIRTGHLKDEGAYTKYQGHEYHRILIEELTHIPSENQYLKLIASCRSTVPGLEPQVMANCNPDGVGFSWVKKRWNLEGTPNEAIWSTDEKTGLKRVFIPSRVEDNPTLIHNDPNYINMLKGLPDGLREAWLYGSWSDPIIPGAYYTQALMQMRAEGRIGVVPHDASSRVWTVWDLGIGKQLVCLFVQRTSTQINIIDTWQGDDSDGMPQAKKMLDSKPYIYAGHFAPHDASRTETGTGKTIYDSARELGLEFMAVPNLKVRDGIDKALMMLSRVWVDETKCEQALESWRQYRRVWDEKRLDWRDEPLHDWASHYSDTLRYLALTEDMMTGNYSNTHVYIPEI